MAIADYSVGGCVISIVVGFVGAFLGMWLARQFGLPELFVITVDGEPFPVVWSLIGSAVLAAIVGLIARPRPAY
ncbi:MAG: GlsB/YeaQ/YmgE family stress response membrane protein [Caldilineaceae bacterium]